MPGVEWNFTWRPVKGGDSEQPDATVIDICHKLAKIAAAQASGDLFRAAYVAGVTLWPILEAVWAANDKPVPPCGSVWAHIGDLDRGPPDAEARLRRLFTGRDADRVQAAVEVIGWTVPVLREDES